MNLLESFTNLFTRPKYDEDGYFTVYHEWVNGAPRFNDYSGESAKIIAALSNPALLKVICLNCDLFSLGRLYEVNDKGEKTPTEFLKHPNKLQTLPQLLWDTMFWKMLGTAYLYFDSDVDTVNNSIYCLNTTKIVFPSEFINRRDKMLFSSKSVKDNSETLVRYRYDDGTYFTFKWNRVSTLTDLTNGLGNYYKGNSRIDALTKVISNVEKGLDAKNINLEFMSKYIVSGTVSESDVTKLPMGQTEKDSVEKSLRGKRKITAVKSPVDIKRFVSDYNALGLDAAYESDYFVIGSMFNIPKDVLEAYKNGSTFENQEKATAKHVSYALEPFGIDLCSAIGKRFDKKLVLSWEHLPFMQVMELDKEKIKESKVKSFTTLLKSGVSVEDANLFLGTNFKTGGYGKQTK